MADNVRYRWGSLGDSLGPPRTFKEANARFATRMAEFSPGKWRMRRYSKGNFSKILTRQVCLERLGIQAKAERKDADRETWVFKHDKTGKQFVFREVVATPPVELPAGADGFWHDKICKVYKLAFGEFPERDKLEFWGAYNCRPTRQGGSWSMHCDWPPVLAGDFGHEYGATGLQDRLEAFLKARVDGLVFVTHRDNSLHKDHVHVQVGSNRSGTPQCAR